MKKNLKNLNLTFFLFYLISCCFLLFVPSFWTMAQEEDDEDIEWLDEEDEGEEDNAGKDKENKEDKKTAEKNEDDKDIEWLDEEDEMEEPLEAEKKDSEEKDPVEDTKSKVADESDFPDSETNVTDTDTDTDTDTEPLAEEDSSGDEYERSLYETYIQYYSEKVSVEDWNNVVGGKDAYSVQERDTLWDISKILFGDPNYWPKLWATNPFITNPHLIQPNDALGFVHGTEGAPPSLSLIKGGLTQNQKGYKTPLGLPKFLKGQKIEFPPSKKPRPVIQSIPASLPPLRTSKKKQKPTDMEIEFKKHNIPTISFLKNYMADKPINGQGIISDKKEYGSWFHFGQSVILEMDDPVDPGTKLTIVKNKGKLYSSKLGVRGPFGYQIEVQGEVEVVGRVPDSFDLYEAKVTKALYPIAIGSLVLRKSLMEFDYKSTQVSGKSEAQIIGVPSSVFDSYDKPIASPYSLVYLNRGAGSGLSVGQMYQIKANPSMDRQQEYGYDIKMGEVKIIHAEDRFSTGVITGMNNPIYVGDYITALDKGILTQRGYDPLDEDIEEIEDGEFEEFGSSDKASKGAPSPSSPQEDPYGDEDIFEAFE